MKKPLVIVLLAAAFCVYAQTPAGQESKSPETAGPSETEKRLTTIRYGTDTEIAALIKALRSEQLPDGAETPLDNELLKLAESTKNKNIVSGIFSFFADRKKEGLEDRAVKALDGRDDEPYETVAAAIDYLGKVEYAGASSSLEDIISGGENRYLSAAIRAMGRISRKGDPVKAAEYLIDYYTNRDASDENRREIIVALGESGAKEGVSFLSSIVENNDERGPLRMAALDSLSKIAAEEGLPSILKAVSSADPNVRSSAVGALGPFSGDDVDTAILEAFRDSYYRTRIAAAQAARNRKLESAVPYLCYRAENDDVPQVRDEAIKALGAIDSSGAEEALAKYFNERKNSDRVRITSGEVLLQGHADTYAEKVIAEMDDARTRNQTALYNGLLRILGNTKTEKLENLAQRFFASGGVIEKSYALDICLQNDFKMLTDQIKILKDPKNGSLARKAASILEKWGVD